MSIEVVNITKSYKNFTEKILPRWKMSICTYPKGSWLRFWGLPVQAKRPCSG